MATGLLRGLRCPISSRASMSSSSRSRCAAACLTPLSRSFAAAAVDGAQGGKLLRLVLSLLVQAAALAALGAAEAPDFRLWRRAAFVTSWVLWVALLAWLRHVYPPLG